MMIIEVTLEEKNGIECAYGIDVTDYYVISGDVPKAFATAIKYATEAMQKETGCKYAKVLKAELIAD